MTRLVSVTLACSALLVATACGEESDGSANAEPSSASAPEWTMEDVNAAPDEWRPERWLDGEGKLRTPEGLLPVGFSLGARNCVGQALAMAELKRVTAALASRFVFEAVEPPTPDFFLTLKPSGARLRARRWSADEVART